MNKNFTFLVITALFAFHATPVWAESDTSANATPTPSVQPAPSNPTPDRSANIRINPLGLLIGELSVDVDFGIAPSITIGPTFSYLSVSGLIDTTTSLTAYQVGLRANFYLTNTCFHDSWYLAPEIDYVPVTVADSGSGGTSGSFHAFALTLLLGYQWLWDSGFNITLGGGAAYYSLASSVTLTNSDGTTSNVTVPTFSGITPALEFGLGWAF